MDTAKDAQRTDRVIGYDVARSVAMLGMIVVHFSLVAAADRSQPAWMAAILTLLDGRASATFVILAGIGITFMSRRAVNSGDQIALAKLRRTFCLRGLFLLVLGFINLTIWSGDILRVYGVSLLLVPLFLTSSSRRLLLSAVGFALAFALLMMVTDFDQNWEWETLTYRNLWTPVGLLRNLFFDGFRSVLPWTGFVLYGMWLGRLDLTDRRVNGWVLGVGLTVALLAELASRGVVSILLATPSVAMDAATINAFFGTESMPALPLFLLAAGGTATTVIALCVRLTTLWPGRCWTPFVATGQMALTWYCAHIVLGLGTLVALDIVGTKPLPVAAGYGLLFFGFAVLASWAWKSVSRHGPLEWVMRRVAG